MYRLARRSKSAILSRSSANIDPLKKSVSSEALFLWAISWIEKRLAFEQKVKYNREKVKWSRKVYEGDSMSNIADLIESYILRKLAAQESGHVELRRTDIADKISCAPSQISYVLSTRFTPAKGFAVESRRGLGGFIRIAQVPVENLVYQDMLGKIAEDTPPEAVRSMVAYLLKHKMITNREAALVLPMIAAAYATMDPADRVQLLKTILLTLERLS